MSGAAQGMRTTRKLKTTSEDERKIVAVITQLDMKLDIDIL